MWIFQISEYTFLYTEGTLIKQSYTYDLGHHKQNIDNFYHP